MSDFTAFNDGLFIGLIPNNKQAETAWREIAAQTEGTGKVLAIHFKSLKAQLKAAGYTVKMQKTLSKKLTAAELKLLDELQVQQ